MLCQKCKKNNATYHFKQVINGKTTESHLCSECAAGENEFAGEFADMWTMPFESSFGAGSLIGQLLGGSRPRREARSCKFCGATENEVAQSGRAGCAECYEVFSDMLMPYIRRIHGNTEHTGKVPAGASAELAARRRAEQLKTELQRAIEAQEFERAAKLRDEIRALEQQ